jgi:hypothetical protein
MKLICLYFWLNVEDKKYKESCGYILCTLSSEMFESGNTHID